MALAIFDDLVAVAIIGLFYAEDIQSLPMILTMSTFGVMIGLSWVGQARPLALALLGTLLWVSLLQSGIKAGLLAGVGFTMGLFVTALAFDSQALEASARLAILFGSGLAAIAGSIVLWFARSDAEQIL